MTIYSEINIAKRMIQIFETYEERIQRLEKKMEGREKNE
jgi:PTS system cellobiose-specific IIA component